MNTSNAEIKLINELADRALKETFDIGCGGESWAALYMRMAGINLVKCPDNVTYFEAVNVAKCISSDCCCMDGCKQIYPEVLILEWVINEPEVSGDSVVFAEALVEKWIINTPSVSNQETVSASVIDIEWVINDPQVVTPSQKQNILATRIILEWIINTPTITP